MERKRLAVFTAVGLAAAIAVPTIAFGNARNNQPGAQVAQTPLVARLVGANEVPLPTLTGAVQLRSRSVARVTFWTSSPAPQRVLGLTYSNLTAYANRGSHPRAAAAGRQRADRGSPATPRSPTGSHVGHRLSPRSRARLATEIVTTPANFYVNVHTRPFPRGDERPAGKGAGTCG